MKLFFAHLFVLLIALPSTSRGATKYQWTWARVAVADAGLIVDQGGAMVIFSGAEFHAKLFDKADPVWLRSSLRGSMVGENVTATEYRENSDVDPLPFNGGVKRFECVQKKECRISITLTDGFNQIILVSSIEK